MAQFLHEAARASLSTLRPVLVMLGAHARPPLRSPACCQWKPDGRCTCCFGVSQPLRLLRGWGYGCAPEALLPSLPRYRKNLKALYVVHPTNFIKVLWGFFKPFIR